MSKYKTVEARVIPVLKTLANGYAAKHKRLLDADKAKRVKLMGAIAAKRLTGVVAHHWLANAKMSCSWSVLDVESGRIKVGVALTKAERGSLSFDTTESRRLCNTSEFVFRMTTITAKLTRVASYLRLNAGSTKEVLALPASKFKALVSRYIADITADHTCSI